MPRIQLAPRVDASRLQEALVKSLEDQAGIQTAVRAADTPKGGYLHWDQFRRRPAPPGWSAEELWRLVWMQRQGSSRSLPLQAKGGVPFVFRRTEPMLPLLHRIDTRETLWQAARVAGPDTAFRLMAAIDEAHHSSAIEGAVTTRRQSRELIRSGREPRSRSERMVLNNLAAMEQMDEWCASPLTPELIRKVQATVTIDTLDDPADVGRVRQEDDIHIVDATTGEPVFTPPPTSELPDRLERLCEFANSESTDEDFLHPLTRAILIHHQLAYDHPFADGNGRTARALFLWSTLRAGYHWFRSLSISRAIYRARGQYYRAFRYVQTDGNDVTYFVRQQMACVEREIEHLARHLAKRASLERWLEETQGIREGLNDRQLALIDHALTHPEQVYTAREHLQYHRVTQPTAWKDLKGLVDRDLLVEAKAGRKSLYSPSERLKELAVERRREPPSP